MFKNCFLSSLVNLTHWALNERIILLARQIKNKKNTTCVDLNAVTCTMMHVLATQDDYQRKKTQNQTKPNTEATDVESVKTSKTFRLD